MTDFFGDFVGKMDLMREILRNNLRAYNFPPAHPRTPSAFTKSTLVKLVFIVVSFSGFVVGVYIYFLCFPFTMSSTISNSFFTFSKSFP